MRKFTYLISLVAIMFGMSCTDTNIYSPPAPAVPVAQEYSLESIDGKDFFQALTTEVVPEKFEYTYNSTTKELYIVNTVITDSKSELQPTAKKVVNNGKEIEITYTDLSPAGTVSVGTKKNVKMEHYFKVNTVGSADKSIKIRTIFTYPNGSLGSNRDEYKTIKL